MTVIRGADIKIEIQAPTSAWSDVTCEVTSADWTWGAVTPLGPLTETEGGWLRVSLLDPTRKYDPANESSSLHAALQAGMPMRATVDGSPAWTGALESWAHDPESGISDLRGVDPLGELAVKSLERPASTINGTTEAQVIDLLDKIKWPAGRRYFPTSGGESRGSDAIRESVLDMLQVIRYAELGALFARRDGAIGWWNRAGPTPPAVSATINCDGVGLVALSYVINPNRQRNRVIWTNNFGVYGDPTIPEHLVRSVSPEWLPMHLAVIPPGQPFDTWAAKVLAALADPEPLSVLGTMVPVGAEVQQIVCSEYGARWEVRTSTESRTVTVLGMTVTVEPGMIEVEAITENVPVPPTTEIVIVRDEASDGQAWEQSGLYSDAREGTGLTEGVDLTSEFVPVGQEYLGGPYRVSQMFMRWNTGAVLPDNAIIDGAWLTTWVNAVAATPVTLEARSRTWGPTLTSSDFVPGSTLGSLTLLASLTSPTLKAGETYSGWHTWVSTAAFLSAINKTGYTEFVIASSKQRTGTAPTDGVDELIDLGAYEAFGLPPYLQVKYHLPGGGPAITKYRDAIMATSGLVGYWRLGESSTASAAADERGVHPGSYAGSPLPTLGAAGAVSDTNTSGTWVIGSWVNVPDVSTLDLGDAWTIEAWINPATLTSGDWRGIVGKGPGGYYLRLNQSGYLELVKSDTSIIATSTVTIPAGAWAYVVATKSGATCKLYVNAVDRTGTVTNATTVNTTAPLTIGADTATGGAHREGYAGGLDEVALYSRALSASEVSAHYAARA